MVARPGQSRLTEPRQGPSSREGQFGGYERIYDDERCSCGAQDPRIVLRAIAASRPWAMTGHSAKPKLDIVVATDMHAAALAEFYSAVWNGSGSVEDVLMARAAAAEGNLIEPGQAPPTFLAVQDGRVLGHVGSTPIRIWDGHLTLPAYWIRDLMVLPEYRNGPLGFALLRQMADHLERSAVLTIVPASRRLFGALGYEDLGAVRHLVRPLRLGRLLAGLDVERLDLDGPFRWMRPALRIGQKTGLARLAGGVGGALFRAVASASRVSAMGFHTRPEWPADLGVQLDHLWEMARPFIGMSVVRDGAYLLQRYGTPGATGDFDWVGIWSQDVLTGVAIMRRLADEDPARLPGIRLATVEDMVVVHRRSCLALLHAVERRARSQGADAVVARMSSARLGLPMSLQGYVRLTGDVHFFIRDVSRTEPRLRGPLSDWWLTHGDG